MSTTQTNNEVEDDMVEIKNQYGKRLSRNMRTEEHNAMLLCRRLRYGPGYNYEKVKKPCCEHMERGACYCLSIGDNIKLLFCGKEMKFYLIFKAHGKYLYGSLKFPRRIEEKERVADLKWSCVFKLYGYETVLGKFARYKKRMREKIPLMLSVRKNLLENEHLVNKIDRELEMINLWKDIDLRALFKNLMKEADVPIYTYSQADMIKDPIQFNNIVLENDIKLFC